MIKGKESETLELKESLTQLKNGIISIAAILNKHEKGKVIFGIKDNRKVVGVSIGKNTLREVSKTISEHIEPKIFPKIKEKIIEGKTCLVVEFKGKDCPYFAYGRAYMRTADEDRLLSAKELENIIITKNKDKINWDTQTDRSYSIKDISETKLKDYVSKAGLRYTSKKEALRKLELIKNDELTNASIILFGKDKARHFSLLSLRCAVFSGKDKSSEFIDMKEFHGDLFELIERAEQYILEHINVGMRLDGLRRINVPEISQDAFREAIINAFCHRDYSISQEVQIAIFKDKVEILSPGKLYAGLTIKEILSKPVSERRNSLIADIFHKISLVEKWGTGVGKIKRLEPDTEFRELSSFFIVTFKRKILIKDSKGTFMEKTTQKTTPRTTHKTTQKILELIKENPSYSRKEMSELIENITEDGIKYHLRKLRKEGRIKRVSSDKKGYWEIIGSRKFGPEKTTPRTTHKTTQKILELIKENPSYSRKEMSELIENITEDGVKYHLRKLRKEGRIKRLGSDKKGYWEIVE